MRYAGLVAKTVLSGSALAYAFAGQTHALAPSSEIIPAGQLTHALAFLAPAAPEYFPPGHWTHALALLAPATPEYDPAVQFVQLLAPSTFAYVPATQFVQFAVPAAAYFPFSHVTHTPGTPAVPPKHGHLYVSK